MRLSVRHLTPVACVAGIIGAGLAIERAWAQPDRPRQEQPAGDAGRRGGQPGGPGGPGGQGRPVSVEGSMKSMNRAMRALKTTIGDPGKRDESLRSIWAMEAGAVAAKSGKPDHLEGKGDQALDEFRRDQIKLVGMMLEMETAVMDGKTDAATAVLGKIEAFREEAHKRFGVKDDEGGR
jgi:soluble cytochrome b562